MRNEECGMMNEGLEDEGQRFKVQGSGFKLGEERNVGGVRLEA
jgi:hypothetical protein